MEPSEDIHMKIDNEFSSSIVNFKKIKVDDFTIMKVIGRGSYGKVLLVKKNDTNEILAMKILKKKEMIIRNQVIHIKNERKIMEMIDHPFIIKLKYAFQNRQKLYLLTDFCPGGELFFHIQKIHRFNEEATKFYAAQITLALECLHSKDIIYRE
jgi:serine/threonine protein kinase